MFWSHDWQWQLWLIMPFSMVVFWALVVWAVVALTRTPTHDDAVRSAPGPEQILAERYARGEIDADEYHERLAIIRGTKRRVA